MTAIFISSSMSEVSIPGGMSDLGAHALAYAGLGALLTRALAGGLGRSVRPTLAVVAVVAASAYGVTDEFHQSFVPGRDPSGWDLLADTVGAALGAGAVMAWGIVKPRLSQR